MSFIEYLKEVDNRVVISSFSEWEKEAKAADLKVKRVTVAKTNIYYQAIKKDENRIVGFF